MCLRKLLRTHIVRKIPTICLLTILTYDDLLFRFRRDSRSISPSKATPDGISFMVDLKELYFPKDLDALNDFIDLNELGLSKTIWGSKCSGGSGQHKPILSDPLSILVNLLSGCKTTSSFSVLSSVRKQFNRSNLFGEEYCLSKSCSTGIPDLVFSESSEIGIFKLRFVSLTSSSPFSLPKNSSSHGCTSSPTSLSLSCRISSSKFGMSSNGLNFDGDGGSLKHLILVVVGLTLFNVSRMISSHLATGRLSSAPNIFPAFNGTISWKLQRQSRTNY